MLVSLGVENFRSFKKKTDIKLKPITVFVGKNSCGKSSFLRLFPLFRQSVEANTMGPMLWFGRYVDFGDFNNVLFRDAKEKHIKFSFNFIISPEDSKRRIHFFEQVLEVKKTTEINLELTIGTDQQKTNYNSIDLSFNNVRASITNNNKDGIHYLFNNTENETYEQNFPNCMLRKVNSSSILPQILAQLDIKKYNEIQPFKLDIQDSFLFLKNINSQFFYEEVENKLRKYFSPKTDLHSILFSLYKLKLDELDKESLLKYLKNNFKKQKTFIKNLENDYQQIYRDIFPMLILANVNSILGGIDENLNKIFSNIRYIAPIRAIAERFYRFQDLQINEMDHTGSNVAMILNSLNKKDKNAFATWVNKNFNFSISVEESGFHYTINIIDENNVKYNISDMGFGYSQLLPIIMSLWLETEKKSLKLNNELFFVIEQPELHLHPAYQAQLAKLFSKIITKASRYNIKIIVETHSQYFINALGESVEQKQISKDDISIVVFNKKDKETDIQEAYFDKDGTLENWPIGFFSGE